MKTAEELIAWLDGRIKRYPLNEWLKETREFISNSKAASAPSVPDGWQLVPTTLTKVMRDAMFGHAEKDPTVTQMNDMWSAVLSAAPKKED